MAQFYKHTPKHAPKRMQKKPVGVIGEMGSFAYGYNGRSYYVTEGVSFWTYYVTKTILSFTEAKALFNALVANGKDAPHPKKISKVIKECRKKKHTSLNDMYNFLFFAIDDLITTTK